jgi:hypothetical protein
MHIARETCMVECGQLIYKGVFNSLDSCCLFDLQRSAKKIAYTMNYLFSCL